MSNIILPGDPDWHQPIIMGKNPEQLTPNGRHEQRIKDLVSKQEKENTGTFKYAATAYAHAPDAWVKNAQMVGQSNMMASPQFFSPLHTNINWQTPGKRRELYQWARFFYQSDPKVAAAIDFYSRFPMNSFKLQCFDTKILKWYDHFVVKRLKLNECLKMISSEYFMLGDVFIHLDVACQKCNGSGISTETKEQCNHPDGIFKRILILNPDWVEVQQSVLADEPAIVLMPDEELKRIVFFKQPKVVYERIPDNIKQLVIQNKPIPLSNRVVSHLKHMPVPYGTYGTSLIRRLFTTLAYKTKLMSANWIVAERLILPIKVVKVGSEQHPATSADIADIQQQLTNTSNDPSLTIVTHHNFDLEYYGASGKILQVTQEMEFIGKEILDGFMLNQSLLNGEMCLPNDHEILTINGYQNIEEYCNSTTNDQICIWDDMERCFFFENPTHKYIYNNVEHIYEIKSGSKTLFKCTGKHDIVVKSRHNQRHDKIKAEKLYDLYKSANENGGSGGCYLTLMRDGQYIAIDSINKIEHNSSVYCVGTSTGYFVAKYEDFEFISGNSGYQCHDIETEVLTKDGFKKYDQVTENDLIGTLNKDTGCLEFCNYIQKHEYDYDGDLIHFDSKRIDCKVTPNHRMFVKDRKKHEWEIIEAEQVNQSHRFNSTIKWVGNNDFPYEIQIDDDHLLSLEDYIKIVCYFATEGSVRKESRKERSTFGQPSTTTIYQSPKGKAYDDIKSLANSISYSYRVRHYEKFDMFCIHNKKLSQHLIDKCGNHSSHKKIPSWIKELPVNFLKLALDCLIAGDGYYKPVKHGRQYGFEVKSKQLAEDVFDLAFKCGYAPLMSYRKNRDLWTVDFSDASRGRTPYVKKEYIKHVPYTGKVWCFTVKNGLFVTRRNGKIGIHGNSAQVGVETLIRRVESWRDTLAAWVEENIFKPTAEMHGFIDHEKSEEIGETCFLYPTIKWNDLNLKDRTQYVQLLNGLHDKQLISSQTLLEHIDIEYDEEVKRMRYEQSQGGMLGGAAQGGAGGDMGMGMGDMGGMGGGGGGGAPGGDMGNPMQETPGMGGGAAGGMDAGGMGMGDGMAPSAGVNKIMKKGKNSSDDSKQVAQPMIKLTSIEQKMAGILVDVMHSFGINPQQRVRAQYPIKNPKGGPPFKLDFAIPHLKLNLECLDPNSIVRTKHGSKFAYEINREDVLLGDRGKDVDINMVMEDHYNGDVVKIKGWGMLPINVTSNHPILVSKPIKIRVKREEPSITRTREYVTFSDSKFIKAKDIQKDDYLLVPRVNFNTEEYLQLSKYNSNNPSHHSHVLNDIKITQDVAWLFGMYAAEGSCNPDSGSQIYFSLNCNESEYISKIQHILLSVFNLESTVYTNLENHTSRVCACSLSLCKFLHESFGHKAPNKTLPNFIFTMPNNMKMHFLEGYSSGDGCVRKYDKALRIMSSSIKMIADLQLLCNSIGLFAAIVKSRNSGLCEIQGRKCFQQHLYEIIIHINKHKKRQYREDENYFYIPVKNVTYSEYEGTVFNFETTGDGLSNHTYCVSNVVTHNCDGEIWHSHPKNAQNDKERDYLLAQRGWTVLRFDDTALEQSSQAVKNTVSSYVQKLIEKQGKKTASINSDINKPQAFIAKGNDLIELYSTYENYIRRGSVNNGETHKL